MLVCVSVRSKNGFVYYQALINGILFLVQIRPTLI